MSAKGIDGLDTDGQPFCAIESANHILSTVFFIVIIKASATRGTASLNYKYYLYFSFIVELPSFVINRHVT